jgi:hypothetical protein
MLGPSNRSSRSCSNSSVRLSRVQQQEGLRAHHRHDQQDPQRPPDPSSLAWHSFPTRHARPGHVPQQVGPPTRLHHDPQMTELRPGPSSRSLLPCPKYRVPPCRAPPLEQLPVRPPLCLQGQQPLDPSNHASRSSPTCRAPPVRALQLGEHRVHLHRDQHQERLQLGPSSHASRSFPELHAPRGLVLPWEERPSPPRLCRPTAGPLKPDPSNRASCSVPMFRAPLVLVHQLAEHPTRRRRVRLPDPSRSPSHPDPAPQEVAQTALIHARLVRR